MRRRRLPMSSSDPSDLGESSGPRIDRIPPTRPPWRRRQFRELKKLIFSPPSKCPIDLFGPVANRTILKRLHGAASLAPGKDTSKQRRNAACSRLSIVQFATGPKRSMGHVLGAKKLIFLIRGRRWRHGQWRPRRLNPVNPCQTGLPGVA